MKEIPAPKSFHKHFEIVARYYGVKALDELEDLKNYARKSLKDYREFTLNNFEDMAGWMADYLPEPEKEGVVPAIDRRIDKSTSTKKTLRDIKYTGEETCQK